MTVSAEQPGDGWLALVATPIGNLEDITLRALATLRQADLVAVEDTRRTRKLLTYFDIHKPTVSYHAHSEHHKTPMLLDRVERGEKIALVTDAGTPGVSDPGFLIVREATARGIEPLVIPGASAVLYAVVASALPVDRFVFAGYPPTKSGKRRTFLRQLTRHDAAVFIFESPYRVQKLMRDICEELGDTTAVAVIREATKVHEEKIRGKAGDVAQKLAKDKPRGEYVIGIDLRGRFEVPRGMQE